MMFEKNVPWDDPSWLEEDELIKDEVNNLTETEITSEIIEKELQSVRYESPKVIKSDNLSKEPHYNEHNRNKPVKNVKNFRNNRNYNNDRRLKQTFPNNHNQECDRTTNNRNNVPIIERNITKDNENSVNKEELNNTNDSLKRPSVAIYSVHSVKGKWSNTFSDENNKSMLVDQKTKNFSDRMSKKPNYIPKETSYNQNQFIEDKYQNSRNNQKYSLEHDREKEDKNRMSTNSSVPKIRENSTAKDDKSLIDDYRRFQNRHNPESQEPIYIERTIVNDNYDSGSSYNRCNNQNKTKNNHLKSPEGSCENNNKRNTNEKREDNRREQKQNREFTDSKERRQNSYEEKNVPNDKMKDMKLNDKPFPEKKEFKHPYDRKGGNKTDFRIQNGDGNNFRINRSKENNETDNNFRRQQEDQTIDKRNHFRNFRNGTFENGEDSQRSPNKNDFQNRNRNYNNVSTVENDTINQGSRRNVRDRLGERINSNGFNNNTSKIRSNNRDKVQ